MEPAKSLSVHLESDGKRWAGVGVRRLSGREAISELFDFTAAVAVPATEDLDDRAFPGAAVTIVFERDGLDVRRVHGIVAEVSDELEASGDYHTYEVRIAPRAHLLSLVEIQEVYLEATIPEVLKQKLEIHGLGADDFELRLIESYPKREIIVQHGETDLAFVRRLAEHVGISFFFEHGEKAEKWVFTDHVAGFGSVEGAEEVHFHARGEARGVFALRHKTDLIPGTFFVQDYNYRAPLLDPSGQFTVDADAPGGIVEYGSHVKTPDEATWLAKIRGEERLARKRVYEAKSSVVELTAGKSTKLLDHPRLGAGARLLVVELEHEATFPLFAEGPAGDATYRNTFRAIPAEVRYRPARRTPKPRMPGVVTGVIQPGPSGEVGGVAKLTPDGRYTVQLHFDTAQRGQQRASHPVRMAQPFAGQGNGMHFPLLPGTEVLIAFANGDPDRPVIVGALPNPMSPAPVVDAEARTHRIVTSKGVTIEFGSHNSGQG
jgi:type VI secretion system secreted protein VgrG